ncbi:MAG: hypothetical protein EXS52_01860 [Candidatus Staskawiczbacteria bacterium]|nr:hypothetical protein [Candidatus Staskawiczbacteria bacterium]
MKIKHIILAFLCVSFLGWGSSAFAMTQLEKEALIQSIISQIAVLQIQLNQQLAQQNGTAWCYNFNTNLSLGTSGNDAAALNKALSRQGLTTSYPSSYFTSATRTGVIAFQEKYASDILLPLGLLRGTGIAGLATRAKLNTIYGCENSQASSSITIIYPNAGQMMHIGDTARIAWSTTGLTALDNLAVMVYMSNQPYLNVKTLADSIPATQGYIDWTITEDTLPSTSYPTNLRVRIEDRQKNISVSSVDFIINSSTNNTSSISLVTPNGGETLYVSDTYHITWNTVGLSPSDMATITIYRSADPYSNIKTIESSVSATRGYYDWVITSDNLPSTGYPLNLRMKIAVSSKNISDLSASDFTVNATNSGLANISLISPDGGQTLYVGDTYRIQWTSSNLTSSDTVNLSVFNPANPFSNIKTITNFVAAGQGYYDWTISKDGLPSTSFPVALRIKIDVADKNISDSSTSDFTVNSSGNSGPASITVAYPNGGQIFTIGTSIPRITWSTLGFTYYDTVSITAHLFSDPYLNVGQITDSIPATQGYFDWIISEDTVPAVDTPLYILIESPDRNVSDKSNTSFKVRPRPLPEE